LPKILITGGSGFIGSFITEKALDKGYETYASIRKTSSLKYLSDKRIKILYLNLTEKDALAKQLSDLKSTIGKFDYIIHVAGISKAAKPEEYDIVNFNYTKNFINALISSDMIPKCFIYISSLASYGPGKKGTKEPVKLSDTPCPINLYGKSKLKAEKFIQSQINFPYLIFRPTGVYGPREKDYFVFFQTINRGIEAYVGYDKQYITFIYIKDLVTLLFKALESSIRNKEYFVSDGKYYDTETFSRISKDVLNKKTIKIKVPLTIVRSFASLMEMIYKPFGKIPTLNKEKVYILEATNWICDVEPLKTDFNFEAEYDLEKGVREAIEWYKNEGWLI